MEMARIGWRATKLAPRSLSPAGQVLPCDYACEYNNDGRDQIARNDEDKVSPRLDIVGIRHPVGIEGTQQASHEVREP